MTSVHTLNRSPSFSVPSMTPYEAYLDTQRDVSHFHIFGCDAYVHVPKKDKGKLDPTSQKMSFVGYNPVFTGYRQKLDNNLSCKTSDPGLGSSSSVGRVKLIVRLVNFGKVSGPNKHG